MRTTFLWMFLATSFGLATVATPPGARAQPAAADDDLYIPTAENLTARQEFQDARFGVFIHWGVYSVLGRGEWVMENEKIPYAKYKEVAAAKFNPTAYDPDAWCRLFKEAGAKYVTITSKHHDGFCLWDSAETDWDVVDATPYGKDLLKPLAEACQRHGLKLFFYHSQVDWSHPEYYPRGYTGRHSGRPDSGDFNRYIDHMNRQLTELLGGRYGDIAGIWFDGWWDQQSKRFPETKSAPPHQTRLDWRLADTYGTIHRVRPTALIGSNHHVKPFPGEDFQMYERDLPGENKGGHSRDAQVGNLPLETCDTINRSWGYNAGDKQFKSLEDLVRYVVRAAGRDANFLLNLGPKPDGTIDDDSAGRLRELGAWLGKHAESIYGTHGGPVKPQPWGVTTHHEDAVFLHLLTRDGAGEGGWLRLEGTEGLNVGALATLVGGEEVAWRRGDDGRLAVRLPEGDLGPDWVLRLSPPAPGPQTPPTQLPGDAKP